MRCLTAESSHPGLFGMGACALLWCLGVWAGWQSGRAWLGLMVVGDYLLPDALFGCVFGGFYLRGGVAGSSHIDSLVGAMS